MAKTIPEQVNDLADFLYAQEKSLRESAQYYEATHRLEAIGLATPPEMRCLTAAIGWPRMILDSIEERLDVEGFRLAGQSEQVDDLWDWWQANDMDEESSLAHLDALIYGRSYITVAAPDVDAGDEPGVPIIRVESPLNMYAEVDPRTRKVTRAIRLYKPVRWDEEQLQYATLYLPDETHYLVNVGGKWQAEQAPTVHNLGVVPVVPMYNRERLSDRQGTSEITPEIRSFTDAAARTMMNMQAASELMAVPQRVLFGVNAEDLIDPGSNTSVLETYMARIIALENETAKAFQFSSAELRNFTEVLEQLAKHIASYTGLPPQYLSFNSDNPASAEAIKSSESRLVKKCERKARMFGGAWEQVMRLCKLVIDGSVSPELYRLETIWRDPSTPTFASKADAVSKLKSSGIIPTERARIDLGYTDEEREEMREWDEEDQQKGPMGMLARQIGTLPQGETTGPDQEGRTPPEFARQQAAA